MFKIFGLNTNSMLGRVGRTFESYSTAKGRKNKKSGTQKCDYLCDVKRLIALKKSVLKSVTK